MTSRHTQLSQFSQRSQRPPSTRQSQPPARLNNSLQSQALSKPGPASPEMILSLQRQSGNQAVQRLLSAREQVQRKAVGRQGGELDSGLQSAIEKARGGGQALDKQAASSFGEKLGADFSGVRVHTDTQADTLSRSLHATAFTTNNDIFFSQGVYNPSSSSGQRLLAHELTHVVQQGGGKTNKVQTKLKIGTANDRYEQEASQAAKAITKHPHSNVTQLAQTNRIQPSPSGTIQRNVGFEFEVPLYPAYQLNKPMNEQEKKGETLIPLNQLGAEGLYKGKALARGKGFELQIDEANTGDFHLEFVTIGPGFEESKSGYKDLETAMTGMQKLGGAIQKLNTTKGTQVARGVNATTGVRIVQTSELEGGIDTIPETVIKGGGEMEANPQTTAGIRLDQLPALIKNMTKIQDESVDDSKRLSMQRAMLGSKTKPNDKKVLAGATLAAQKAIKTLKEEAFKRDIELSDEFGSDSLVGLMTLIYSYLKLAETTEVSDYPKALFPLLGISNFGAMYRMLPKDDKAPFLNNPGLFVELNLMAADMEGQGGKPFFTAGFAKQLTNLSEEETRDAVQALGSITRAYWLIEIPGGNDVLSQAYSEPMGDYMSGAKYLESMGKFNRGDMVGQKNERTVAPVIELRRMAERTPIDQWKNLALDIFNFVCQLNNHETTELKPQHYKF